MIFNLNIDYTNFVSNNNKITTKFIFNATSKFYLNDLDSP